MHRETLNIRTSGRGLHDISAKLRVIIERAGTGCHMCHLFIRHTSAALVITENADPDVLVDLETWMAGAVPDGDPRFRHTAEGPDDMSAHVRSLLTETSLLIPIENSAPLLGTWQGAFVWEHRSRPHHRRVTVTVW